MGYFFTNADIFFLFCFEYQVKYFRFSLFLDIEIFI